MKLCRDGAVCTTIMQLMEVTPHLLHRVCKFEDKLPLISTVRGTFTCFQGPISLIFVQKILLFINDVFSRSEICLFLKIIYNVISYQISAYSYKIAYDNNFFASYPCI